MDRSVTTVKRWRGRLFLAKNDPVWKAWVNLEPRDAESLGAIASGDVDDDFRARAVALLFAPDPRQVPIYWNGGVGGESAVPLVTFSGRSGHLAISRIRGIQAAFVAEYLCACAEDFSEKPYPPEAPMVYGAYLLDLLKSLPPEEAGDVFRQYATLPPEVSRPAHDVTGMYRAYGAAAEAFGRLIELVGDPEVPERWKNEAEERMRATVLQALPSPDGNVPPALFGFTEGLQAAIEGTDTSFPPRRLGGLLDFLLGQQGIRHLRLFNPLRAPAVLSWLSDDEFQPLRHRFASFMVFGNGGAPQVFDPLSRDAVESLMAEAEPDGRLAGRIRRILERGRETMAREARDEKTRRARDRELLRSMRG